MGEWLILDPNKKGPYQETTCPRFHHVLDLDLDSAWPIRFFLEDKLPSLDFKDANSSWYRILIDPTDLEVVFLLKTNKSMGGFMAYKYARLDPRKPFPSP
jgi:hypothetical protein